MRPDMRREDFTAVVPCIRYCADLPRVQDERKIKKDFLATGASDISQQWAQIHWLQRKRMKQFSGLRPPVAPQASLYNLRAVSSLLS